MSQPDSRNTRGGASPSTPDINIYDGLDADARERADHIIAADVAQVPWRPMVNLEAPACPSPQALAYASEADVLFYGAAAGGGKTDLLIGLALTSHMRTLLLRREHKRLRAIQDRMTEIVGSRAGFNVQAGRWQLPHGTRGPARLVDLGGCQHPGDERAYQGQPHDLIAFDEITEFLESQFRFIIGWNRSSTPGQRCRVVATGNPPTTAEGDWVIRYFAPWLDPAHDNPAAPGAFRWFATVDGEEREVESGAPVTFRGETITPRSRTFIPSRIEDNPYLMATGYRATLQALPEPLRSQMLKGDFAAETQDDPWGVIPDGWVRAAQARWAAAGGTTAPHDERAGQMTALGVDIAQGGRDGLVPSERSEARDTTGALGFANKRAEMWWRMREALDPARGKDICLPPDVRLRADLTAPRWKLASRGIQVEEKRESIKRLGRSPDRGEAAVYAWAADERLIVARARARRRRQRPKTERAYDPLGW